MQAKKNIGVTVYFPEKVLNAIKEVEKDKAIIGERRNSIILKCIVRGLKEEYGINFL